MARIFYQVFTTHENANISHNIYFKNLLNSHSHATNMITP